MKPSLAVLSLALAFAPLASAKSAQQDRMTRCNADAAAASLKGDARKAFMKRCLAGKEPAAPNPQQSKMKDCNAKATDQKLKGADRKAFMSTCLKAG